MMQIENQWLDELTTLSSMSASSDFYNHKRMITPPSIKSPHQTLNSDSHIQPNAPCYIYFFLGPNLGAPISLPRSLIPNAFSIAARTF